MKKLFYILLILHFVFLQHLKAGDVRVTASAPDRVAVGNNFRITFSVNAEPTGYEFPPFKGFEVVLGPSQSSSTSTTIINNKVSMSITYNFSYVLRASKEGTFTVPGATFIVEGKKYTSNSVTIVAVQGRAPSQAPKGRRPQGQLQQTQKTDITSDDVFIKGLISDGSPYLGEQIVVTYKIYTKVPIADYGISKQPATQGFWSESLPDNQRDPNQHYETIKNAKYVVADIWKMILFPQKSGKLKIEPLEIEALIQLKTQGRDPFEDFFRSPFSNSPFFGYQNVKKKLYSNTITVDVKPLPAKSQPEDYNGAVGKFKFSSSISEINVIANDAINVKYTISGSGNIKLIDEINVAFPPDFEVYDPKISDAVTVTESGVVGKRTFDYLVIPRNAGDFEIKPVTFSYFNPSGKSYNSLTADGYELKVGKGDGDQSTITVSSTNKEDVKYIGKDIRHIVNKPIILTPVGYHFFGSRLYYILFLLPLLLFLLFIIIWRRHIKRRSNAALMKHRKATKVSKKRLRKAQTYLKDQNDKEFYIEISRALWGYLSDKFNIPIANLSMDTVNETLNKRNVKEDLINDFITTLNNCEFARFAPGQGTTAMDQIYKQALDIISKLERELR
ncbi:BatD family protein [candidate division KSB1 bacterium]